MHRIPPSAGALAAAPIRHVESWCSEGDRGAADAGDDNHLALRPIGSSNATVGLRRADVDRRAYPDIARVSVGVVELVEYEHIAYGQPGGVAQRDRRSPLGVASRPVRGLAGIQWIYASAVCNADVRRSYQAVC